MKSSSILFQTILLIALLQFKHFDCDGPLQTKAMVVAKSIYGAKLGLVHAGLHGISTLIVLLLTHYPIQICFVLGLIDFIIHYHVDYTKENIVKYFRWGTNDAKFWWALSADQSIHQFTYLGLAAAAISN